MRAYVIGLCWFGTLLHAEDVQLPPAEAALADLRAAHAARVSVGREEAAWLQERQGLAVLITQVEAETQRLHEAAAAAQAATTAADADQPGVPPIQAESAQVAASIRQALLSANAAALPGAVSVPAAGDDGESALRALLDSEREAAAIGVEIVTATHAGKPIAVKLLRVGGALGWWIALDGNQGGVATISEGTLTLHDAGAETVTTIARALAISEGRGTAELLFLPVTP